MRSATYRPGMMLASDEWRRLAVRALLIAFAGLVLLGGADLLLQIHRMAGSLTAVSTQLGALHTMSRKLDRTNTQLAQTNLKLDSTNRQLLATNRKLDRTNGQLFATNAELAETTRNLARMAGTLDSMQNQIGAMTKKITHAKLLF